MILTHGANSLQHGFTPKPIPTGFTRVYGVKSAYRNTAFTLDISSLGITNQDLESMMECYITPFACKPYDQTPYSTNDVCPWCTSTIRLFNLYGSPQYNVQLANGGGSYRSQFATTDSSFGGRKTITLKNNLLDINGATWTCDNRGYSVVSVSSLHLWGPFDNDIYTPITIYEVTVKKGDTVYAHLVPVRDESTGHPNFFDEVSGQVMTPQLGPTWAEWSLFEIIDGVEIGGRMYPIVSIGNQIWLAENLDYKWTGLDIGPAGNPSTQAAWYYNNDELTYGVDGYKCGLMYNWYAVDYLEQHLSDLGIPSGWHVATRAEWTTLINEVGVNPGTKLKAANLAWAPSWGGTDDYGFGVLPGGTYSGGEFNSIREYGYYRVSSDAMNAIRLYFDQWNSTVGSDTVNLNGGYSLRLVKDAT